MGSGGATYEEALALIPHLPIDTLLLHVVPLEQYALAWTTCRQRTALKTLLRVTG